MSGTSGLDFKSVGAELAYWLTHVTSAFKGGFAGSGENGYDFGMPEGTPVYAILPGKVVGVGSYGGGGVVSVQYNPQNVIYYQHLRANQVKVGDQIKPGQQIGLSGGLHNTNGAPVTCCSSYAHIEVGINAPFGSFWNPNNVKPNANPIGLFNSLRAQYSKGNVATVGGLVGATNTLSSASSAASSAASSGASSASCPHPIMIAGQQVGCIPDTVYNWITQPIRILKLVSGVVLLLIAAALVIVPPLAGPATQVAGVATGQPELVAAGGAISSLRRRQPIAGVQVTTPARPREVKLKPRAGPATRPFAPEEEPPPFETGPEEPPSGEPPTAPRRAPTTSPLGGSPAQGTAGFEQQRQAAQAAQNIDDLERRAQEAAQKANDQARSAGERRFWRNAALDLQRQINKAGGRPVTKRAPASKPARARAAPITQPLGPPKTVQSGMPLTTTEAAAGKRSLWQSFLGLRPGQKAVGTPPAPTARPAATEEELRQFRSFQAFTQQQEKDRQESANMTYDDLRKALGIGQPGEKAPGTERTLAGEEEHLQTLEKILAEESDIRTRTAVERDIAATRARIKKMREGK